MSVRISRGQMDYQVEIDSAGRAGNVYYTEDGSPLTFWWEFTMVGAAISVPAAQDWDAYCDRTGAGWAKGRRQEILARIAAETRRQRAPSAKIAFEDEWIVFKF
jgi:hypothetical protein